jgi:hypothetical protein
MIEIFLGTHALYFRIGVRTTMNFHCVLPASCLSGIQVPVRHLVTSDFIQRDSIMNPIQSCSRFREPNVILSSFSTSADIHQNKLRMRCCSISYLDSFVSFFCGDPFKPQLAILPSISSSTFSLKVHLNNSINTALLTAIIHIIQYNTRCKSLPPP